MIIVDSSVWIDYFTGKNSPGAEKLDSLLGEELVAIGDLILTEVLQGFRADKDFRQARKLLLSLTVVNILDTAIALKSAANFRTLRKKGITVRKTIDTIIATYAAQSSIHTRRMTDSIPPNLRPASIPLEFVHRIWGQNADTLPHKQMRFKLQ